MTSAYGGRKATDDFAFSTCPPELGDLWLKAQEASSPDKRIEFYLQDLDTIQQKLESYRRKEISEEEQRKIVEYEYFLLSTKMNIASCHLSSQRPREAFTIYEEIIALAAPKLNYCVNSDMPFLRRYVWNLYHRCVALLKCGEKERALAEMKKALEETNMLLKNLLGSSDDNFLTRQAEEGKLKISKRVLHNILKPKTMMENAIKTEFFYYLNPQR